MNYDAGRLELSQKQTSLIIFFILGLYPLVGMGVDLIAPSLPAISYSLKISNVVSKNFVSIYLLGATVGNFGISLIADSFGRKKLLLSSLFLFCLASLLPVCFAAPAILLFGRFIQGLTIAPFTIVARAIFTDLLPNEKLLPVAIMASTMWGIGPIIGPII